MRKALIDGRVYRPLKGSSHSRYDERRSALDACQIGFGQKRLFVVKDW